MTLACSCDIFASLSGSGSKCSNRGTECRPRPRRLGVSMLLKLGISILEGQDQLGYTLCFGLLETLYLLNTIAHVRIVHLLHTVVPSLHSIGPSLLASSGLDVSLGISQGLSSDILRSIDLGAQFFLMSLFERQYFLEMLGVQIDLGLGHSKLHLQFDLCCLRRGVL